MAITDSTIQEILEKKGFSYAQIARITGVSKRAVSSFASGKAFNQSFANVAPILDLLGIKMQDYANYLKSIKGAGQK